MKKTSPAMKRRLALGRLHMKFRLKEEREQNLTFYTRKLKPLLVIHKAQLMLKRTMEWIRAREQAEFVKLEERRQRYERNKIVSRN